MALNIGQSFWIASATASGWFTYLQMVSVPKLTMQIEANRWKTEQGNFLYLNIFASRSKWTVNSRAFFCPKTWGPWLIISWKLTPSICKLILKVIHKILERKLTCNWATDGRHTASSAFLACSEGSSVITILQKKEEKRPVCLLGKWVVRVRI